MIVNNNILKVYNHNNTSRDNYLIKLIDISAQTDTYMLVDNLSSSPFYFEFDTTLWNLKVGEYYLQIFDDFDNVDYEDYHTLTAFQFDKLDVISATGVFAGHINNIKISSFKL